MRELILLRIEEYREDLAADGDSSNMPSPKEIKQLSDVDLLNFYESLFLHQL